MQATRKISFSFLSLLLVICLCFSSFFNVRKAHAIAPAIPAAGAAVAALAAELGISEGMLMAGIIGITAAGTGVYLLESSNQTDFISQGQYDRLWTGDLGAGDPGNWAPGYQKWKTPNGKTWEDLTPEERADYDSPADYVHSGIASLSVLFPDLFQVGNNGDLEPTPEPDPEQDPQGHEKWVKARNVLIALAAGTGGVALSDAVGMLADNAAGGIKELLFGKDNGFGLVYSSTFALDDDPDTPINFKIIDFSGRVNGYNFTPNNWVSGHGDIIFMQRDGIANPNMTYSSGIGYKSSSYRMQGANYLTSASAGLASVGVYSYKYINADGDDAFLNAAFSGVYNFPNGATYQNGIGNGLSVKATNYGQLVDTPEQLTQSVINNNNWNTYINNYTDAGNDETRTVAIPSFGNGSAAPGYNDFVDVTPNTDVVPIPDDELLPAPDPNPNPNPNPGTQYQEDFGERVQQLLSQPFNNLFPFCLIGDMHDFMDVILNAGNSPVTRDSKGSLVKSEPESNVNGIDNLSFDLSGFRVDGLEELIIPLTPLHEFGLLVRGIFTALFLITLITGTLRFFLTRGGE